MQIYVRAKSKKEINALLESGASVYGTEYTPWDSRDRLLTDCPDGTVVKVFERYISGSPYAKAYGTIKRRNGKVRVA